MKRKGIDGLKLLLDNCLTSACPGFHKELARREAARGGGDLRWFTTLELQTAEALAKIIVPSDEETPGIDEVSVLDAPPMNTLDRLVAASPDLQRQYSRGLLGFDLWALNRHGRKFVELAKEDQIELFKSGQRVWENQGDGASRLHEVWRRLQPFAYARTGAFFAAQLYPQIRNDCLQIFYTSRVSWVWLDYDGPPMDGGYSSVVEPRE